MKMHWRNMIFLALSIIFYLERPSYAQTQKEIQYIKGYLSGHNVHVSYREGGSLYGTYFFLNVHFCSSGGYLLFGQSRKQTVLGNEQVNNWNDRGSWDVVPFQGHATLKYVAASGARDMVPLLILPDGSVRPLSGAFLQRQGKAQCK